MNGTKVIGITVLATALLLNQSDGFAGNTPPQLEEKLEKTSKNLELRIIGLLKTKDLSLEQQLSSALSTSESTDRQLGLNLNLKLVALEQSSDEDKELINKYALGELASVVITDSEGKPLAASLGAITDAASMRQLVQEAEKVAKLWIEVKAIKPEGSPEAPEMVDKFLAALPSQYLLPHYEKEIGVLLKSSGSGPLFEKYTAISADYDRQKQAGDFLKTVYSKVGKSDPELEEFLTAFQKELQIAKLSPEARQLAEMHRFRYLAQARKYDQALECLDSAEMAAPKSKLAKNIEKFRERIKKAKLASSTDSAPATEIPQKEAPGPGQ